MAPTGRAAKVISNYSKKEAFTIHKKIYFPKKQKSGGIKFVMQPNKHRNTIFIVDEASMIPDVPSDSKLFENGSLLDDLMQYVYSGHNCKLLLIGDMAQLPPVKSDLSPALNQNCLELNYNKSVLGIELDEVVRQEQDSGILDNATELRSVLETGIYDSFRFNLSGYKDIVRLIDGYEIMDAINDAYSDLGYEETAIIVRSNKRANLYNKQIRERILFKENELSTGDYLMVVKNNYFWIKPTTEAGFIANGDIGEILSISNHEDRYGFSFVDVQLRLVDYPQQPPIEVKVMLDVLEVEGPSLPNSENKRLFQEVAAEYADLSSKRERMEAIKSDPYFNALQLKFAYAVTAHKSQGGQWKNVIVDQGYITEEMIDQQYARWLYTAITRASERLFLLNFHDRFFN